MLPAEVEAGSRPLARSRRQGALPPVLPPPRRRGWSYIVTAVVLGAVAGAIMWSWSSSRKVVGGRAQRALGLGRGALLGRRDALLARVAGTSAADADDDDAAVEQQHENDIISSSTPAPSLEPSPTASPAHYPSPMGAMLTPVPPADADAATPEAGGRSTMVVVASWNDGGQTWGNALPYPLMVYSESVHGWIDDHHRTEAGRYLHFLCTYYDDLPRYMFFFHGHATSTHHHRPDDIVDRILAFQRADWPGYASFSGILMGTRGEPDGNVWKRMDHLWYAVLHRYFKKEHESLYGEYTDQQGCCAEFFVSAARVRRRPRQLYCDLLDYVFHYTGEEKDQFKGVNLEWHWPLIFGDYD